MNSEWKQRSIPSHRSIDGKGVTGGTNRAMKCIQELLPSSSGQQAYSHQRLSKPPDMASTLRTSDRPGGLRKASAKDSSVQDCMSRGRPMDFCVCFTARPCGHYRIQVSSVRPEEVGLRQILKMLLLTTSAVILPFCLAWVALL